MDQNTRDELLKLFQSKLNEAMRFYLETCTRCGTCAPKLAMCMHPWGR